MPAKKFLVWTIKRTVTGIEKKRPKTNVMISEVEYTIYLISGVLMLIHVNSVSYKIGPFTLKFIDIIHITLTTMRYTQIETMYK